MPQRGPGGGGGTPLPKGFTLKQRGSFLVLLGVGTLAIYGIDKVAHPLGLYMAGGILFLWIVQGEGVSDWVSELGNKTIGNLLKGARG